EMMRGHSQRFECYLSFLRKNGLPAIFPEDGGSQNFDMLKQRSKLAPAIVSSPTGATRDKQTQWAVSLASYGKHDRRSRRLPFNLVRRIGSRVFVMWVRAKRNVQMWKTKEQF